METIFPPGNNNSEYLSNVRTRLLVWSSDPDDFHRAAAETLTCPPAPQCGDEWASLQVCMEVQFQVRTAKTAAEDIMILYYGLYGLHSSSSEDVWSQRFSASPRTRRQTLSLSHRITFIRYIIHIKHNILNKYNIFITDNKSLGT